jgi:hypothetical protein
MKELTEKMVKFANLLDSKNKMASADRVTELIKTASVDKVAQYVGAIGYVLKGQRAMGNCIRRKRVSTKGSMQEVVMQCLKAYQDSQDYDDNEWTSKYAELVTQNPESYAVAHLVVLAEAFDQNDISTHFQKLVEAADALANDGEKNDLLSDIIGCYREATTLLKQAAKERRFPVPFKVAADSRGFWQRLMGKPQQPEAAPPANSTFDQSMNSIANLAKSVSSVINVTQTKLRPAIQELYNAVIPLTNFPELQQFTAVFSDLGNATYESLRQIMPRIRAMVPELRKASPKAKAAVEAVYRAFKPVITVLDEIGPALQEVRTASSKINEHDLVPPPPPHTTRVPQRTRAFSDYFRVYRHWLSQFLNNPVDIAAGSNLVQAANKAADYARGVAYEEDPEYFNTKAAPGTTNPLVDLLGQIMEKIKEDPEMKAQPGTPQALTFLQNATDALVGKLPAASGSPPPAVEAPPATPTPAPATATAPKEKEIDPLTGEVVLRDPTIDDFRNAAAKHDRPDPEAERRFGIKTKPPTTTANRAVFLAKLAKEVESISPEVAAILDEYVAEEKDSEMENIAIPATAAPVVCK